MSEKCVNEQGSEACKKCLDWSLAWTAYEQGKPLVKVKKCMKALKEKWK